MLQIRRKWTKYIGKPAFLILSYTLTTSDPSSQIAETPEFNTDKDTYFSRSRRSISILYFTATIICARKCGAVACHFRYLCAC